MWHASVSLQTKKGTIYKPDDCFAYAVQALRGVGGDHEWWLYATPAWIGHLRVPLTADESLLVPSGMVVGDAGESGPLRGRTYHIDDLSIGPVQ